jgi:hypothetical protein
MVIGSLNISQKDRGHFVPEEILSLVTFCPDDVLSQHVASLNVLSQDVLPRGHFVSGRFFLVSKCPSHELRTHICFTYVGPLRVLYN